MSEKYIEPKNPPQTADVDHAHELMDVCIAAAREKKQFSVKWDHDKKCYTITVMGH